MSKNCLFTPPLTPHTRWSPKSSSLSCCSSSWIVSAESISCSSSLVSPLTLFQSQGICPGLVICRIGAYFSLEESMHIHCKFTDWLLLLLLLLNDALLSEVISVYHRWENLCFLVQKCLQNSFFSITKVRIWCKKYQH